ncbi:hypothetical protein [Blastococcus sp. VKM Ac-2987]|uniref:hypothetical protein n=1 Tax=Blastococcus sp. VKM Ac-2987 TaxID=3004141 RepID=UPI0022ABBA7B|nr:hypothetical protein [Blastococcus sp. VKM Ac-2987]MCZ2859351.1 hypothetical protein [Blastococcus sp. VKM Ac-2987]
MGPASVTSAVGTDDVPAAVLALSSFPAIDYADLFALTTDLQATPEEWARAMFGDVPDLAQQFIWHVLLRLQLHGGRSPDTVAGWRIGDRDDDWIRLEAGSPLLTGNLVVRAAEGRVSLATFVRYDRPVGRGVWLLLSAVHRRLVPRVLREAEGRLRSSP